jgi:hypothetical protein
MAKVKIQGHASGTGILTVTAPNTSTDRTITLPDATGTLATTADSVGGATGVDFNDNVKARFGTGDDLEIYHDGSHSRIKDTGTGNLSIHTSNLNIVNAAGSADQAYFTEGGAVSLYHNGSKKIETTATGVAVTGGVAIGGTGADNTLDDYEEGTFTVTSSDSGGSFYGTGGHYVKVGGIVHIRAYFGNLAGGVSFAGLPFAAESETGLTIQQMYQVNWPSSAKQLLCYASGSNIQFRWQTDTGTGMNPTSTDFGHSSCTLGIAGTYKTTA